MKREKKNGRGWSSESHGVDQWVCEGKDWD